MSYLEKYIQLGGKLMVEGNATKDFFANDIVARWKKVTSKAIAQNFDINAIKQLGVKKNKFRNAIKMLDGSWIFSDYETFIQNNNSVFKQLIDGNVYEGNYCGYAAIKVKNKSIEKFAATSIQSLKINDKVVFALSEPADVLIEKKDANYIITLTGKDVQIITDQLSTLY